MAKLPMQQASKLAETMAKHNVPGMIAMGKPKADDGEDPEDKTDGDKPEMEHCLEECVTAFMSQDKEHMMSALRDLVDCIKEEDEEQDQEG